MTQIIGKCSYSELPEHYRKQYESGRFGSSVKFWKCAVPPNAIFLAILFSLLYIVPALFIIISGIFTAINKPQLINRMIEDLSSGIGFLLIGLLIFSVIVWGLYCLLNMGWRSLMRAQAALKLNSKYSNDNNHYGLMLDSQYLIIRNAESFDDYQCAILPKNSIKNHKVCKVRIWFPKHSYYVNVVKIEYVNENQLTQEMLIKERYNMTSVELNKQIQQWLKA